MAKTFPSQVLPPFTAVHGVPSSVTKLAMSSRGSTAISVSMAKPFPSQVSPPFTAVHQSTIEPLEKTVHMETIDPVHFDLVGTDLYMPVLFAYRLAGRSDAVYLQAVKRIKEALSKVLIPFFTFAGTWVAAPPGSAGRQLLCNDDGVPFIEASMATDLDSVLQGSASFQPVPDLNGHTYVGMDPTQFAQQMPPDGVPPVFVQVTRFTCGGLVVVVTFNHMQVDGEGFFAFMRAWSDLARTNQTAVKVDHNRAQLKAPSLGASIGDPAATDSSNVQTHLGPWAMRSLEVGASTIRALKEAKRNGPGHGYVSTGDCIMAQLLRSVQRLTTSVLAQEKIVVARAVEGRKRFFDIPVPDVSANVSTLLVQPEIANSELLEMPLVCIASRFREQLDTMKMEDWSGSMGKFLEAVGTKQMKPFCVSSWFSFGMYGIDFGFGSPYFVAGPNCCGSADMVGLAYVYPPIPSSGGSAATVNIWASPDVLQALESDPQFREFFLVHEDGA